MKKKLLILWIALCITGHVWAQEEPRTEVRAEAKAETTPRKKYVNFGFSVLELRQPDFPALKSNYGASFTVGRTYFLHRRPIAGILRFGIDATWFDINYANYKLEFQDGESQPETQNYHQAELAMQVGPSISINPVGKLNIQCYFRYAPSFSGLYDGDAFRGNYATVFAGGGAIWYGKVGLGAEARFGSCRDKQLFGGGDDDEGKSGENETAALPKRKFSGMRVYLTLRF